MTNKMKKWQKLSTITLLMTGVIALNNGEFRNVDKHQIAVADTNVQTPDYEKLKKTWLDVNYGYDQYDENNQDMKKRYVFVVVVAILIGLIIIAYAHNKQKKTITLRHKKSG